MFTKLKNFFSSLFSSNSHIITDNKGNRVSGDYLDKLRGAHSGRDAENMKFAIDLYNTRLNNPTHETYADGHKSGAPPIITSLQGKTDEFVTNLLKKESGTYYTGRIKTYTWTHKKKEYFNCLAEIVYFDAAYKVFVHGWQGPTPASGFYTGKNKTMSITGNPPVIFGSHYERNT